MTSDFSEQQETLTPRVQAIVSAPLSFGSLFAGIGGFDLGFERAGMVCKWQVEIDDYANRVLAKHWPNVHRERDVREVGRHNLESVDVICGGFPCQDISYAGLGAGLDGERSGLWFEFARIIREMVPTFVVIENVSALLDRGLDRVLGSLADLGYDAEWNVIPAAAVGAMHRRKRVWIVAYSQGQRWISPQDPHCGICEARVYKSKTQPPVTTRRLAGVGRRNWWSSEPAVARVVHGVPARLVDRPNRCCGNAVVPQITEWIGQRIVEAAGRTPAMCSDAARQDAGDWSH